MILGLSFQIISSVISNSATLSRLFCTESSRVERNIKTEQAVDLYFVSSAPTHCWVSYSNLTYTTLANSAYMWFLAHAISAVGTRSLQPERTQRQWSQIWNRRSVSHSQPACRCESGRERRRGTLPFFFPRHSCMRERLVPFPLILLASSLQCMRFQLFQVLDFRLSFIESKLRNVFFSTPCKRGAKQTTISNLQNM